MNEVYCGKIPAGELSRLLTPYGIRLQWVAPEKKIPGTHFGEPEAGLIDNRLYVRTDTPVHSLLHEACHYICMDRTRRNDLHTDAGGDYDEENAVCYLSILLADMLAEYSATRMMADMDSWGYTFRLGSAKRWFNEDADDAYDWLLASKIIDTKRTTTGQLRA